MQTPSPAPRHASPWDGLLRTAARRQPASAASRTAPAETKTGRIRQLLERGPMRAVEICMEVELPDTGRVYALLKNDLRSGRISFHDGRFAISDSFDVALQRQLDEAARLLRRHGYAVKPPP